METVSKTAKSTGITRFFNRLFLIKEIRKSFFLLFSKFTVDLYKRVRDIVKKLTVFMAHFLFFFIYIRLYYSKTERAFVLLKNNK